MKKKKINKQKSKLIKACHTTTIKCLVCGATAGGGGTEDRYISFIQPHYQLHGKDKYEISGEMFEYIKEE